MKKAIIYLLAAILILSNVCFPVCAATSSKEEPIVIDGDEIKHYVGEWVQVTGVIDREPNNNMWDSVGASMILTNCDGDAFFSILCRSEFYIGQDEGSKVTVTGQVEKGSFGYNMTKCEISSAVDTKDVAVIILVAISLGVFLILFAKSLNKSERKEKEELENIRNNVEKTYIVDSSTTSKVKTGSAITRAVIGEAALGTAGAIAGAASAKTNDKHEVTFLVIEKNGKRYADTVNVKEAKYSAYMEKLHVPGE